MITYLALVICFVTPLYGEELEARGLCVLCCFLRSGASLAASCTLRESDASGRPTGSLLPAVLIGIDSFQSGVPKRIRVEQPVNAQCTATQADSARIESAHTSGPQATGTGMCVCQARDPDMDVCAPTPSTLSTEAGT